MTEIIAGDKRRNRDNSKHLCAVEHYETGSVTACQPYRANARPMKAALFYILCACIGGGLAYGLVLMLGGSMPERAVVLTGVQGAPGDGNSALNAAMGRVLANIDVPLVEDMHACAFAVSAEVSSRPRGGSQEIGIVWQVHDPMGKPLGEVQQATVVEAGALDTEWGTEASLAARNARDGIIAIVRRPREGCA